MKHIKNKDGYLFYIKYGNGKNALLCFHGFGQNNKLFSKWSEFLGKDYAIYAFDLFYHGKSTRISNVLTHEIWKTYIDDFLKKEQIQRFIVFGFSLGGRFAINTALTFPKQTKQLILAAPDGVINIIWFKLATSPLLKGFFSFFMKNTERLFPIVNLLENLKVIDTYTAKFIQLELKENGSGKQVFKSWNAFKDLSFPRKKLIKKMNQMSFPKSIFLGTKDEIIKSKVILPTLNQINDCNIIMVRKKHHQIIRDDFLVELKKILV